METYQVCPECIVWQHQPYEFDRIVLYWGRVIQSVECRTGGETDVIIRINYWIG